MMNKISTMFKLTSCLLIVLLAAAAFSDNKELQFVNLNLAHAKGQVKKMLSIAEVNNQGFPRTQSCTDSLVSTSMYDWTSGFFPGNLWYACEGTKDADLKQAAIRWTEKLEKLKSFTEHHDLGFMLYCSYGNAYRITKNEKYKQVLIEGAKSLSTRFNPKVGSIKSWNEFKSWSGDATYKYPVIIDNMLNLELLFFASKVTGNQSYRQIAISHANNVIKNQVRSNGSCYHVICYNPANGSVIAKETAQGYSNNSTWSRGQAWGIYGFTMVYRETKDKRYLDVAKKMADFYLQEPGLPQDKVPYWDFNANEIGYTPGKNSNAGKVPVKYRDASAAAVTASALLELSTYLPNSTPYKNAAIQIIHELSGPSYMDNSQKNSGFLLMHNVGSIAHGVEIDVPLIYADYYYLEALNRYKRILNNKSPV